MINLFFGRKQHSSNSGNQAPIHQQRAGRENRIVAPVAVRSYSHVPHSASSGSDRFASVFVTSDIHAEMYDGRVPYEAFLPLYNPDITVIAGDLCPATNETRFIDALEKMTSKSQLSFFVAGNHEYYTDPFSMPGTGQTRRMDEIDAFIENACRRVGGDHIIFLRDGINYKLKDTLFVGTTLWPNVPPTFWDEARGSINDYSLILCADGQLMSPRRQSELHEKAKAHIKASMDYAREMDIENVVCVTHHVPSTYLFPKENAGAIKRTHETSDGVEWPSYNYYCTDMDSFIDPTCGSGDALRVRLWCCGHDHCSRLRTLYAPDRNRSSTVYGSRGPLFASNAVAYPSEPNMDYDRRFLVPLTL